jgi:hypothetical protein
MMNVLPVTGDDAQLEHMDKNALLMTPRCYMRIAETASARRLW